MVQYFEWVSHNKTGILQDNTTRLPNNIFLQLLSQFLKVLKERNEKVNLIAGSENVTLSH